MKIKMLTFVAFTFLMGYMDVQAASNTTTRSTSTMASGFRASPSKAAVSAAKSPSPTASYKTPAPVTAKPASGFGSFGNSKAATTAPSATFAKPVTPVSSFTGDLRAQASKDAALRTADARNSLKTATVVTTIAAPAAAVVATTPTTKPTYQYRPQQPVNQPQRVNNTTVVNNYHTSPANSTSGDWVAPAVAGIVIGAALADRNDRQTVIYRDAPQQVVYEQPYTAPVSEPTYTVPTPQISAPKVESEDSGDSHWFAWTMFLAFVAAGGYWWFVARKTVKPNYSF